MMELRDQLLEQLQEWQAEGIESGDLVPVVFAWSEKYGQCYDCGLPAAYCIGDDYEDEAHLRCSICAAELAAGGDMIARLDFLHGDV